MPDEALHLVVYLVGSFFEVVLEDYSFVLHIIFGIGLLLVSVCACVSPLVRPQSGLSC